jgi:histone arginine demethylase JMJD6
MKNNNIIIITIHNNNKMEICPTDNNSNTINFKKSHTLWLKTIEQDKTITFDSSSQPTSNHDNNTSFPSNQQQQQSNPLSITPTTTTTISIHINNHDSLLTDHERKKINKIKLQERSDLKSLSDWSKQQWYIRWPHAKRELEEIFPDTIGIDRIHCSDVPTVENFREKYEIPSIPIVIHGLADDWPARTRWNAYDLYKDYRAIKLKAGEDDEENPLKVRVKTFLRYQFSDAKWDDSPLYVFDSAFKRNPDLSWGKDYCVPYIFPEDLFELVGERRRPPNEWFLIGPERSGTTLHIDPLCTSAWNTLIRGRKLWVMFPPSTPRLLVKGRKLMKPGEDDEAVDYFVQLLPRILSDGEYQQLPDQRFVRFIQYPGETVFVPHGWWHAVLNLDDTLAITQNFVSSVNFPLAWRSTRVERRKMARKWLNKLAEIRPDLYQVARDIDHQDQFNLDEYIASKKKNRDHTKNKDGSGRMGEKSSDY